MMVLILNLCFLVLLGSEDSFIIDSNMSFEEAIAGSTAPQSVIDSLVLLNVIYYSTDNKLHKGQILVNKAVQKDINTFFKKAQEMKFPIKKVVPIVKYNWDDDASMADNNSSAFNYRFIAGTKKLSNHSFGRAIDINPYFNPVIYKETGKVSPSGAKYNPKSKGVFSQDNPLVILMKKLGWRWGGDWTSLKDYHHFDKP